ncbi:putative peptide chain release factor class I [Helianthus annuus]|nr:putative peptide chain release factor class I [Helianthus annuus]
MGLISEDSLNVEIPDEDLQLGFSRACGSGGQNVNKVESVVRITRIPTGVTVRCTVNLQDRRIRNPIVVSVMGGGVDLSGSIHQSP